MVSYDPDTGKAVLSVDAIGGAPGKDAVFELSSFFTGEVRYDFAADSLDLVGLLDENEGKFTELDKSNGLGGGESQKFMEDGNDLHDITEVLEQDALSLEIPGYAKGVLSNISYRDNRLHLQMNPDNERGNEALMLSLVHKTTNEEIQPYYSVNYGRYTMGEMSIGGDYQEYVFEVSREELKDYNLRLNGWYYENFIEGDWSVGFQLPERAEAKIIQPDASVKIGEAQWTLKTIEASVLSLTLEFTGEVSGKVSDDVDNITVKLAYQDKLLEPAANMSVSADGQEGVDTITIRYHGPIAGYEGLTGVEVNGVLYELGE
jgi:hypothetical protein